MTAKELFKKIEERSLYREENYVFKAECGSRLESQEYFNRYEEKVFLKATVGCILELLEDKSIKLAEDLASQDDLIYHVAAIFDDTPVIDLIKKSDKVDTEI